LCCNAIRYQKVCLWNLWFRLLSFCLQHPANHLLWRFVKYSGIWNSWFPSDLTREQQQNLIVDNNSDEILFPIWSRNKRRLSLNSGWSDFGETKEKVEEWLFQRKSLPQLWWPREAELLSSLLAVLWISSRGTVLEWRRT
jgi:hypothetical protein